jgi:hypothetical protein
MISPFLQMNFMSTPVQTSCQMDLNSRWGAEEHLSLAVILSLLCARPHHGFDAPNPTVSLHFLANVPLQSKTYPTIENAPNMLLVISCSIPQIKGPVWSLVSYVYFWHKTRFGPINPLLLMKIPCSMFMSQFWWMISKRDLHYSTLFIG